MKLQLYAGPNVNIVRCSNRDSSLGDLYKMTLPEGEIEEESQTTAHKLLTSDLVVWTLRKSGQDWQSENIQKSE